MRVFDHSGLALHWREDGAPDGLPVVFANSLGTDLRVWDKILPRLPDGLRLMRFDTRGHGLSDAPDGPYSIEMLASDTAVLLDHAGVRGAVFVGLSIGGMIGQVLAARRPDLVHALVLSNTAAKMGEAEMWRARIEAIAAGGIDSIAEAVLERWFSPAFRATGELAAWRNMLTRTPVAGYTGCCAAIAGTDLSELTAALRLPVLGIGGSEDAASPPALVAATTQLIPGARYAEISGAGHLPGVEDPGAYASLIAEFIEEVRDV